MDNVFAFTFIVLFALGSMNVLGNEGYLESKIIALLIGAVMIFFIAKGVSILYHKVKKDKSIK